MDAQQITNKINAIYEGIEKSKCGKMFTGDKDPAGNPVFNTLAMNTYFKILDSEFPKEK